VFLVVVSTWWRYSRCSEVGHSAENWQNGIRIFVFFGSESTKKQLHEHSLIWLSLLVTSRDCRCRCFLPSTTLMHVVSGSLYLHGLAGWRSWKTQTYGHAFFSFFGSVQLNQVSPTPEDNLSTYTFHHHIKFSPPAQQIARYIRNKNLFAATN